MQDAGVEKRKRAKRPKGEGSRGRVARGLGVEELRDGQRHRWRSRWRSRWRPRWRCRKRGKRKWGEWIGERADGQDA